MDISASDIIASILMASAAHTGGHFDAAGDEARGAKMRLRGLNEFYDGNRIDKRGETRISAGGFDMQDRVAEASDNRSQDIANAAHKIAYLSGILTKGKGDIKRMEESSGNRHVDDILAATIISNILSGMKKSNTRLRFTTYDGAPGVEMNMRW